MYTIQQATANKIVIPYDGNDYDFLLIVFTYSCYESVGIFENLAPGGCDYEIIVNEVGRDGTSDPENGDVKISPRSTWTTAVYGQNNNTNLLPQFATLIDVYKSQVKGDSCVVYPNGSPIQPPLSSIIIQLNGVDVDEATVSPYNICIVNTIGAEVGTVGEPEVNFSDTQIDTQFEL